MNTLTTSKSTNFKAPIQNISYQLKNTSAYNFTNFFESIHSSLRANADKQLLEWHNGFTTGKLLLDKISGIRNELILHCVAPAEEVIIIAPLGEEQIASVLAIMALGAIPVLPDSDILPKDLLKLIRNRRIKTVLSSQAPLLVKIISNFSYLNIIETAKIKSSDLDFPVRQVNHHQGALVTINSSTDSKETKTTYQSHKFLLDEFEEFSSRSENEQNSLSTPNLVLYNLCKGFSSYLSDPSTIKHIG